MNLGVKSVNVAINGTLIDRESAKQLKLKNINVQVSIDGDVAKIHDLLRGVERLFTYWLILILVFQNMTLILDIYVIIYSVLYFY